MPPRPTRFEYGPPPHQHHGGRGYSRSSSSHAPYNRNYDRGHHAQQEGWSGGYGRSNFAQHRPMSIRGTSGMMPRIPSGFAKRSTSTARSPPRQPPYPRSLAPSDAAAPGPIKARPASGDGTAMKVATYWCKALGQGLLVDFRDSWVLDLVSGDQAAADRGAASWKVVVPGICPFHIIAKQPKNGKVCCGGMLTHGHESQEAGPNFVNEVTDKSLVLKQPLVTVPMPMHALIMSPELRAASLYFYYDLKFKASYPESYANLQDKAPEILEINAQSQLDRLENPACHRILQQKACERRWKLNEEYQYSVECWASRIGSGNMLTNCRGNRVPYPQDERFRSSDSSKRVAFGFWSSFQQDMWRLFLTEDMGPCYLDAVFDVKQNGFQLWTLLFEYGGQTVPVSFLLTTSVTTGLLGDWLAGISGGDAAGLPKRTMYVNTMRAYDFVGSVFPEWDIRYAKYYIVQELRELVLRGEREYEDSVVGEVQRINADFLAAFKALRGVKEIAGQMNYIFSKADEWMPRSKAELAVFNHSSDALARWRYLLWMTMLGRPTTTRIDLVLYYLHQVLMPGVERACQGAVDREPVGFSMDGMECGGKPLHESVRELRRRRLNGALVCVSEDRELDQKAIVDTELQVCYCERFLRDKVCAHLVFCMPAAIHHPGLPRLLQEIPKA